jgi:hypothetical protein
MRVGVNRTNRAWRDRRHARTVLATFGMLLAAPGVTYGQTAAPATPQMSPGAAAVPDDQGVYKPDPSYTATPYDPKAQIDIYGGKHAIDEPRPIEALRLQYEGGPFDQGLTFLGDRNLVFPAFQAFGDWRSAVAWNKQNNKQTIGQIATTVDLDVDLAITSTERLHGLFKPLERKNEFTRCEFFGPQADGECHVKANAIPQDLFFEGDLGSIYTGFSGQYTTLDLPFAVGMMPMIFQNGIWVNDAFTGGSFSLPAKNSPMLDISNMDITFFAGFDKVVTPALLNADGSRADHNANIFGAAGFVEANHGYWEGGYGYVQGKDRFQDLSYSSATVAFTGRFRDISSDSLRLIWDFGQNPDAAKKERKTADGVIILLENSIISPQPYTLVPYFNAWAGFYRPAPLTSTNGNLLTNTGINFETDALTNFPKLDDSGQDTWGGALGVEYLFGLDQQIVVEGATVQVFGNPTGRPAKGDEYALGVRYQLPLTLDWIFRADAMQGWQINNKSVAGARAELRLKF